MVRLAKGSHNAYERLAQTTPPSGVVQEDCSLTFTCNPGATLSLWTEGDTNDEQYWWWIIRSFFVPGLLYSVGVALLWAFGVTMSDSTGWWYNVISVVLSASFIILLFFWSSQQEMNWDPKRGRLVIQKGICLDDQHLTISSSDEKELPFHLYFYATVKYRAEKGPEEYAKLIKNGMKEKEAEIALWDPRSVLIWNLRELPNCQMPSSRPPGEGISQVLLLGDAGLKKAAEEFRHKNFVCFGCDAQHLANPLDKTQAPMCKVVQDLLIRNAHLVWPDENPDPTTFIIKDSSMFCGSDYKGVTPPMHNVRSPGAHAKELHLDIDVRAEGVSHAHHVNVWVPLSNFTQWPVVFMRTQSGNNWYDSPADDGNFTQFSAGECDRWSGAFPRVGECLMFSPLTVPHGAARLEHRGRNDRYSVEFRFERVNLNKEGKEKGGEEE